MSNLSNNELLKMLNEKTKENIKTLSEKEMIFKNEQLQKNYSVNVSMEYTNNSGKKPIPINIIYHTLYDQETNCQSSNGKQSFQRHLFTSNKDYDIIFDKKTLDNNSAPNFFKMKIEESLKNFIESNNSIKDKIDDLDNYPKIFEFQYNYQHPIPKPVFMGPKLLQNTDSHKIIFISPICLIFETKGESTGFAGIDCFYTSIRHKFDMELNEDLTIKKTIYNNYFGVNFTKSSWLQSKITSSAMEQAEEGFNGKYLPLIIKELNLTVKKYSTPTIKKINLKDKNINIGDTSLTADDVIINDSFISDIEDNEKYKINNKNGYQGNGIKDTLFNNIYLILFIFIIIILIKFLGKEYITIILLSLIVYHLYLINNKLDNLNIKHL